MTFKPFVAIAFALVSIPSLAAVYRWVDSEGHVHYTDKAEAGSEQINVHTGQPISTEPAPSSSTPSTSLSGDALTQKKGECDQAKKKYESYRTAVKVVETDSLGRKHEYTPDELKQLQSKSEKDMRDVCSAAGVPINTASGAPVQ